MNVYKWIWIASWEQILHNLILNPHTKNSEKEEETRLHDLYRVIHQWVWNCSRHSYTENMTLYMNLISQQCNCKLAKSGHGSWPMNIFLLHVFRLGRHDILHTRCFSQQVNHLQKFISGVCVLGPWISLSPLVCIFTYIIFIFYLHQIQWPPTHAKLSSKPWGVILAVQASKIRGWSLPGSSPLCTLQLVCFITVWQLSTSHTLQGPVYLSASWQCFYCCLPPEFHIS